MLISEVKINIADADITCYYCISKRITNKRKFGNPAVVIILFQFVALNSNFNGPDSNPPLLKTVKFCVQILYA